MTKAYLIVGDYSSSLVEKKIKEITNDKKFNYTVSPKEGKIDIQMVNEYVDYFAFTSFTEQNIGVIYDFNLISEIGQNKLLKTIEENMDNTVHIFLAMSYKNVLQTILSRVVYYDYMQLFKSGDDFFDKYINNIEYYKLYAQNEEYQKQLKVIQKFINEYYFDKLFTYLHINIKVTDKQIHFLIYTVIVNSIRNTGDFKLLEEVLKYEKRFSGNENFRIQLLNIIIIVKEFYDNQKLLNTR